MNTTRHHLERIASRIIPSLGKCVWCAVCKRPHLWTELRYDGVQEYAPGDVLEFGTCGAGNTLCRQAKVERKAA